MTIIARESVSLYPCPAWRSGNRLAMCRGTLEIDTQNGNAILYAY